MDLRRPTGFVNHAATGALYGLILWPLVAAPVLIEHLPAASTPQQAALVGLALAGEAAFVALGGALGEPVLLLVGIGYVFRRLLAHFAARLGLAGFGLVAAKLAVAFALPCGVMGLLFLVAVVVDRLASPPPKA